MIAKKRGTAIEKGQDRVHKKPGPLASSCTIKQDIMLDWWFMVSMEGAHTAC